MANKKCPKCGEDNPAEAVMCWACYTPLTAGASAGATAPRTGVAPKAVGGKAGAPGAKDDEEKKKTDPKVFVVGGVLAVGAVAALFMSGMLGGSSAAEPGAVTTPPKVTVNPGPSGFTGGGGTTTVGPPPPPPPGGSNASPGGSGGGAPPPPSYAMLGLPSPRFKTATFGIAPSQPVGSPQEAFNLAETARQQLSGNGKWSNMQIFVFADADAGQTFNKYMTKRRGQPLTSGDYSVLAQQNAWDKATIFYEVVGKEGHVSYPSQHPSNWWTG